MPSQEWNDIQIENTTGNAPKIANRMKNGEIAAYCGRRLPVLARRLRRGPGPWSRPTVVRRIALLVTAISDRPRSGEFAFDLVLRVLPGLVGVLAGGLDVDQFGGDRAPMMRCRTG